MNDYSFFSAPQLKRDPLGGSIEPTSANAPMASIARPTPFLERWVTSPRSLIGYALLLGAVAGTSVWFQHAVRGGALAWIPTLAAIGYYTISGYAGIQLLRRDPLAHTWALAAVTPQLVQFQSGHVVYKIVSGLHLSLAIDPFGFDVSAGVASLVQVGTFRPVFRTTLVFNLLAFIFAWYLYRQREGAA